MFYSLIFRFANWYLNRRGKERYPNPPKVVQFFKNGMTAVFDHSGQQMPTFQYPWIVVYVSMLRGRGVDIEAIRYEMDLSGKVVRVKITELGRIEFFFE